MNRFFIFVFLFSLNACANNSSAPSVQTAEDEKKLLSASNCAGTILNKYSDLANNIYKSHESSTLWALISGSSDPAQLNISIYGTSGILDSWIMNCGSETSRRCEFVSDKSNVVAGLSNDFKQITILKNGLAYTTLTFTDGKK